MSKTEHPSLSAALGRPWAHALWVLASLWAASPVRATQTQDQTQAPIATEVKAGPLDRAYVLLERQRSASGSPQFKVLRRLWQDEAIPGPFETGKERARLWRFALADGFPAFDSRRFECRNPAIPAHCLPAHKASIPSCSAYAQKPIDFVRLSYLKSTAGDTPQERGKSTAWLRQSEEQDLAAKTAAAVPSALTGALSIGVAVTVGAPALAMSALKQPECVGLHTQWVEFDHTAFESAVQSALSKAGLDKESAQRQFLEAALSFQKDFEALKVDAEKELALAMEARQLRVQPWLNWIRHAPPTLTGLPAVWPPSPPEPLAIRAQQFEADAQWQFDGALGKARQSFQQQLKDRVSKIDADLPALEKTLKSQASLIVQHRMAMASQASDWLSLAADLERWGDPADHGPQVRRRVAQWKPSAGSTPEWVLGQKLQEAKARAWAGQDRIDVELRAFRDALETGDDTSCGVVLSIERPMIRIAIRRTELRENRWLPMGQILPPGMPCQPEPDTALMPQP